MANKDISRVRVDCGSESSPTVMHFSSSRLIMLLLIFLMPHSWANAQSSSKSIERLKADVYYFASDTLEGRGISTPGIVLAAGHIRSEFKRIGLKSGTRDGSYYQSFEFGRTAKQAGVTLHNVVGVLEGKGAFSNETIIIGA